MMEYDAIVVGGGHNGLVAGFYLARAGLRTVILERRDIVGGACVTEEFAPGLPGVHGRVRPVDAPRVDLARHAAGAARHPGRRGRPHAQRVPRRRALHRRRRHGHDARRDATLLSSRRGRARAVRRGPRPVRRRSDPVLRAHGARPARPERTRSPRAGARRPASRSDTAETCWIWRSCSRRPRRSSWRSGSSPST